jgi:hypothetical protein
VCRFHVAAGEKLHADKQLIWRPCPECHKASKHHLLKFGFLLLVRFNLGFTTEGRLTTVLIIPSSWGSQRAILTSHQPLLLYIAATHQVVSTVLVVERSEEGKAHVVQRSVYFLSEVLSPTKQRYPHYQKLAFSIFTTARKLWQYSWCIQS